jgi:hypothetical protein
MCHTLTQEGQMFTDIVGSAYYVSGGCVWLVFTCIYA